MNFGRGCNSGVAKGEIVVVDGYLWAGNLDQRSDRLAAKRRATKFKQTDEQITVHWYANCLGIASVGCSCGRGIVQVI